MPDSIQAIDFHPKTLMAILISNGFNGIIDYSRSKTKYAS